MPLTHFIYVHYNKQVIKQIQMKYEVIFVAGNQRLSEQVYANNPREAQRVVQARNPNARIVNVCGAR
jgi:hypothetical protein